MIYIGLKNGWSQVEWLNEGGDFLRIKEVWTSLEKRWENSKWVGYFYVKPLFFNLLIVLSGGGLGWGNKMDKDIALNVLFLENW